MNRVWGALSGRSGLVFAAVLALTGCGDEGAPGGAQTDERGEGQADERRPATPQATMNPEAGFVEVGLGGRATAPVVHRLFYSFFPAESHPEDAPVLVFFNGGPGSATTAALWLYGTGPYVIDPEAITEDDLLPRENAFPYTRFANLLYIDARGAGFSHELLRTEPPAEPDIPPPDLLTCRGPFTWLFDTAVCVGADALDFIEVVLEFLDSHRALSNNPVVLVGESYGGNRAVAMLSMLQHYEGTAEDSIVPDYACAFPWLRERVQAHVDLAFPEHAAGSGPDQVAAQFGWQVLIQPGLTYELERDVEQLLQDPDLGPYMTMPGHTATHDVRLTLDDVERLDAQPATVNSNPASVATLMGVDPGQVTHLSPQNERGDAFRFFTEEPGRSRAAEAALRESLGDLTEDDAYWLLTGYGLQCNWQADRSIFYEMVGRTHTFMTNARYDALIWADGVRATIEAERGAEHDTTQPAGASRPGIIRFAADDGSPVEIRFPEYDAGHVVTMSTPRELGEDVEAWLHATGAIR